MSTTTSSVPAGVKLGIVRGITYGVFGPPDEFMPQTRALGAQLVRAYLYWGQVEPQPGQYTWAALDALLAQLDGDEEVWLTLSSSSLWATRQKTDFLPPSPALDVHAYAEFVRQVVRHCAGRVHYWQCDNEPSNTGLLWAGTAPEYVAQLEVMYAAVKEIDARAAVVLGGCGYDVLSSPHGSEQRAFFDHLVGAGGTAFDVFDLHLYGDPYCIPEYVRYARELMRAHGYEKPIVAGEYAGPALFEFPEIEGIMQQALASAFAAAPVTQSTQELVAQSGQDTPERLAMKALYARISELPPRMQMFMADCPAELEARRHRISCRQLVTRNLLALAEGIRRTSYWQLAPEVPGPVDPYQIMHLLFGKLPLLDYTGTRLDYRHPEADCFARLTEHLAGVEHVERFTVADAPSVYAFRVERAVGDPVYVLWDRRDAFDGECLPALRVAIPWHAPAAHALDVFGNQQPTDIVDSTLRLALSDTPVYLTA